MRKIALVALAMLRQNRWQLLLLLAWPWIFTGLLSQLGGAPTADDISSLLHQECFYGLALTAILAANALGAELRSRRAAFVLSRAVSREQYLIALWLTAVVPGAIYLASMLGSGLAILRPDGSNMASFLLMLAALFALMLWIGTLGLLFSLFLPGLLASLTAGVAASLLLVWTRQTAWLGLGALLHRMLLAPPASSNVDWADDWIGLGSVLVQTGLIAWAAWAVFRRRDIPSTGE